MGRNLIDDDDVEDGDVQFDIDDDGDLAAEQALARLEDEEHWANQPGGYADYAYDPIRDRQDPPYDYVPPSSEGSVL